MLLQHEGAEVDHRREAPAPVSDEQAVAGACEAPAERSEWGRSPYTTTGEGDRLAQGRRGSGL